MKANSERTKFIIPVEDRELFVALSTARDRVVALKAMLDEYETTEKKLAARVFSKHGIPPDQDISYREWMVFAIGGVELPNPPAPTPKEKKKK